MFALNRYVLKCFRKGLTRFYQTALLKHLALANALTRKHGLEFARLVLVVNMKWIKLLNRFDWALYWLLIDYGLMYRVYNTKMSKHCSHVAYQTNITFVLTLYLCLLPKGVVTLILKLSK